MRIWQVWKHELILLAIITIMSMCGFAGYFIGRSDYANGYYIDTTSINYKQGYYAGVADGSSGKVFSGTMMMESHNGTTSFSIGNMNDTGISFTVTKLTDGTFLASASQNGTPMESPNYYALKQVYDELQKQVNAILGH